MAFGGPVLIGPALPFFGGTLPMKTIRLLPAILAAILYALPSFGAIISGVGGHVSVNEVTDGLGHAEYSVTVANGPAVAWFAISNNGSTFTANTDGTYPNWSATVLNAAQWNSGTVIFGPNSGVNFNTSSVGTYSSLFDSDALVTVFYQNSFAGPGPIAAGTITGFHFFYPSLAGSDFVAGTANGLVLDKSRQASVATPEPASLAIWGLGALGCAVAGHRRRHAARFCSAGGIPIWRADMLTPTESRGYCTPQHVADGETHHWAFMD